MYCSCQAQNLKLSDWTPYRNAPWDSMLTFLGIIIYKFLCSGLCDRLFIKEPDRTAKKGGKKTDSTFTNMRTCHFAMHRM